MKNLIILGLFISSFSFAQTTAVPAETPQQKNELGLNLFSVTDFSRVNYRSTKVSIDVDYNFATGIYYKRHFGKNAWRASFNYYQKAIAISNYIDMYSYTSAGVRKSEQVTAGYQREFGTKKFAPFVFSDLVFRYANYSGIESYYGDFTWCNNCPFHQETFEYGMDAGFGLKYKVTRNITLSYEASAEKFYSVSENLQYPGNGKFKEFSHRLNPLSQLGFALTF